MLFPPSPWLCPSMGCSPVLRLRVWISLVTCWVPKRILILAKFRTEGPVQDLHPKWRPVNFFHHRLRQFQRRRKIVHQFRLLDTWRRRFFTKILRSESRIVRPADKQILQRCWRMPARLVSIRLDWMSTSPVDWHARHFRHWEFTRPTYRQVPRGSNQNEEFRFRPTTCLIWWAPSGAPE
jgi:hypothetical protein